MPPETLNLLLGAAIALLSSTITAIISHFLQTGRDNQAKKWEIENQQRVEEKLIITKRLEALELKINELIQDIQSAYNILHIALFVEPLDIQGLKNARINRLKSYIEKLIELQASSGYFSDPDLSESINDIFELGVRYTDLYDKVIESAEEIKNDENKLESTREEISNLGIKIATAFSNIYVKLDLVRINSLKSMQGIKRMNDAMTQLKKSHK